MLSTISLYPRMLPYIFGENHEGINLNLGGPIIGEIKYFEKDGRPSYDTNRLVNNEFIAGLWENISLITAIVGRNGTGKTSILKSIKNDELLAIDENNQATYTNERLIIYYSPFLSYNEERDEGNNVINISKYSQLKSDLKGDELGISSLLEVHNSEFIKRLITLAFNESVYSELLSLGLPEIDYIKVKLLKMNEKDWNISMNFRPFFDLLDEIRDNERIKREQFFIEKLGLTDHFRENEEYRKESYKIRLEHEIINSIILKIKRILEYTGNRYLEEGFVSEFENFKDFQSYKDAFYWFIDNAYFEFSKGSRILFPVENIKSFTEKLLSMLNKQENFDNWLEFHCDKQDAYELIDLYIKFILSFKRNFTFDDYPILEFSTNKELSSGEKAMFEIFSLMNEVKANIERGIIENMPSSDKYLILLDEADMGFHPTWKKKYINLLVKILPLIFVDKQIQIIFTTHDPLTLSDIPASNIIFLDKGQDNKTILVDRKTKNTFGANISELLADSFFVEDGLIGDFAKSKIEEIINWINENKNNKNRSEEFFMKLDFYKRIIEIVDERILKIKLSEMISELEGNTEFRKRVILKEIDNLTNQLEDL